MSATTTRTRRASRTARLARQADANRRRNGYVALAARVARHQPPLPAKPVPAVLPATVAATVAKPDTVPDTVPDTKPDGTAGPVEHVTTVTGANDMWIASCSCGEWATPKPTKTQSSAKGAATKHRNQAA